MTSESVLEQPRREEKGGKRRKMEALSGYSSELPQEIPFPLKLQQQSQTHKLSAGWVGPGAGAGTASQGQSR